jgi:hypothetical protein
VDVLQGFGLQLPCALEREPQLGADDLRHVDGRADTKVARFLLPPLLPIPGFRAPSRCDRWIFPGNPALVLGQ